MRTLAHLETSSVGIHLPTPEGLSSRWPTEGRRPGIIDLHEAVACRRVSYDILHAAVQLDRAGIRHQRFGRIYRLRKADLDEFGRVEELSPKKP